MKTTVNILLKVFVKQFYIVNAGFFLFFFFFFFGIVKTSQLLFYHKLLMQAIIISPLFMMAVMTGWLLYNLKCILFCSNVLQTADNNFLHILKALPVLKQCSFYFTISLLQYMPVLVYAGLLTVMATHKSAFMVAVIVCVFQAAMIVLSTATLYYNFTTTAQSLLTKAAAKTRRLFKIKTHYNFFLFSYIMHSRKMALTAVKIFSLLLLSVSFVRNGDNFDADLFSILFQVILAAHAALIFYCTDFIETKMIYCRNLPRPWYHTAGMYIVTWGIILLPELIFMLVNNHSNLPVAQILLTCCTAAAALLLYTGIAYATGLHMERYMLFIFITFLLMFFLQKTGWHVMITLATIFFAAIIFRAHYFSFEREI